jgi:threonine synthase
VCFDVLEGLIAKGDVQPHERIVVFNTGAAQKYLEALSPRHPSIDKDAVDWSLIEKS